MISLEEGLWEVVEGKVYLRGSKCTHCGEVFFPQKGNGFCSHCQHESLRKVRLSSHGKIINYTIVYQQPAGGYYRGPMPFAYGVVQLPDGVNVVTQFTGCQLESIKTGLEAHLVLEKLYQDDEGSEVVTYKFVPVP